MRQRTANDRPLVGLLYNPATPQLLARAPELIEFLSIMPDRLWFDFGPGAQGRRFHRTLGAMERIRGFADGRTLAGHGIGMSLPSAVPLDETFVAAVAEMSSDLGGFQWYSEHLSVFIAPKGSVPNAQAGLGLPLAYDEESYAIVSGKLRRLREVLGCRLLLETGAFFMPVPDSDMSEPEFLNRLYREGCCGTLLDLHNIHVSALNDGMPCEAYLAALDPDAVEEIHLGGGDDFAGFYMDSHSSLTPPEVWRLALDHAPRFRRLRAITFEFQETYFEAIGADALIGELERMHELAAVCRLETADAG
jgi:uncharacterized protein (UPF0276 family)